MKLYFKDEDFDGQLLRAISYAPCGGADIGECFETASRIEEGDRSSWYEAWTATADRVRAGAEKSLAGGHPESARGAFLRASNYYRAAEFEVRDDADDPRGLRGWRSSRDCFVAAGRLFDPPFEKVEIPYEATTLPGYLFRVDDSGGRRPTLITMSGMDGYVEETFFQVAAAGLARGYNCLSFDGPGQGGVLRERGVTFRPDWEAVVTPVVDFAAGLPGVDPDRLALVGRSFGGYLAPRAAASEHRLAACVVDPGQFDLSEMAAGRLPFRRLIEEAERHGMAPLERISHLMGESRRFFVAARMRAFGAPTLDAFVGMMRDYSLKGLAEEISCPTLVCDNEADAVAGGQARELYDALRCPKDYVLFTAAEGADGHCEGGAQTLFHARMFDWLDEVVGRTAPLRAEQATAG